MRMLSGQSENGGMSVVKRKSRSWLLVAVVLTLALVNTRAGWGIQKQPLSAEEDAGSSRGPILLASSQSGQQQFLIPPIQTPVAQAPAASHEPAKPSEAPAASASGHEPAPAADTHAAPAAASGEKHAAEGAHGEGHGPALAQVSPIPGVTFVQTMIDLMEYELNGRTLGWRPNDIIIGRFTDNVNNFQLGVLETLRFTTLRLKDGLTRMGDADTYDPDLEAALNLFMNRSTLFWFPSAESAYSDAIDHLRKFKAKLETGQRFFYYRKDNLQSLLNSYKDLLGNVNKSLIVSPVSWFKVDDYFYYAKGVSHVIYEMLRVIRVSFQGPLSSTLHAAEMMDEVIHELHRVEEVDPWIILDADLGGLLANHRANINAPLSETAHLLGVLGQI